MATLRDTMLAEQQLVAAKRRFGLFSQPPPLSVGDDSYYRPKQIHKGSDGKPATTQRGVFSGLNRSGVSRRDFIEVPESIYAKDPYIDRHKQELKYYNKLHSKSQMHECEFKPASGSKTLASSSFEYVEQKDTQRKRSNRNAAGRVVTQPSNILTNPMSTVESRYMKCVTHISDPYQRADLIKRSERKIFQSKLQEAPFITMATGGKIFTKDKIQYGIDEKTKSIMEKVKSHTNKKISIMTHEEPFKPSGSKHGKPIGKFPQYIGSKCKTESSTFVKATKHQRDTFKLGMGTSSRPTPSISLNAKNWHFHAILKQK